MQGIVEILVRLAVIVIEMTFLLIFIQIVYSETYKVKPQLFFCLITVFINFIFEYICSIFDINDGIRTLQMLIVDVIFLKKIFRIKYLHGIALHSLFLILYAFVDMVTIISFYLIGIKRIDFDDVTLFSIAAVIVNFTMIILLLIIKSFKSFFTFPKELKSKIVFVNFVYIFLTLLAILVNTSFYIKSPINTLNIGIIIIDVVLLCFLVYNIVISNKNQLLYKQMLEEINSKNKELSLLNEQLKAYAQTAEELAVARERNRFARDVHDSLGHSIILLLKLLQIAIITNRRDPDKTEEILNQANTVAKEGLNELRYSISGLVATELDRDDAVKSLDRLIKEFSILGVNVNMSVPGDIKLESAVYSSAIYRICQEAITNSIKHGRAQNIHITLECSTDSIKLDIADDGTGCTGINKGFGLSSMEKRVSDLKGSISFKSDAGAGFSVNIVIPLEAKNTGEVENDKANNN